MNANAVADPTEVKQTARAMCGSEKLTLSEFIGMSIADIRAEYGDLLNVPADASASVNGKAKSEDYELKAKDQLIFSRPVGQKG
jgi:hypothetical protein